MPPAAPSPASKDLSPDLAAAIRRLADACTRGAERERSEAAAAAERLRKCDQAHADRTATLQRNWAGVQRGLEQDREVVKSVEREIRSLPRRMPKQHSFLIFQWENKEYTAELGRLHTRRDKAEAAAVESERQARDKHAAEEQALAGRRQAEREAVAATNKAAAQQARVDRERSIRAALDEIEQIRLAAERMAPASRAYSSALLLRHGPRHPCCTVGHIRCILESARFQFPLILPLPQLAPILVQAAEAGVLAVEWAHQWIFRLLTSFVPGEVRLTLIDPTALGRNFAPFLDLIDHEPKLLGEKVWTKPREIEEQLGLLELHAEYITQKYLRDDYATLEEYNRDAGETAEPHRCLIVHGFPEGFSDQALKQLETLWRNGPRCGIVPCILATAPDPKAIAKRFAAGAMVVRLQHDGGIDLPGQWPDAFRAPTRWESDGLPRAEVLPGLLAQIGEIAGQRSQIEVDYFGLLERAGTTPQQLWQNSSASGLSVPLGPSGPGQVQSLALGGGTAQHALIAGKTGSGKSTLLHNIITTASLRYSPEELQFYLIDFKQGVEFQVYAAEHLPHARVIGIESEREFGMDVLRSLRAELDRRGAIFRTAGAADLPEYRRTAGASMPRLLLVVDEFQMLFEPDDALAREAAAALDHLVRQGRAFGVHVLLATQTLSSGWSVARATLSNIAVRIALQCSETDSRLILGEENLAARLMTRKGEAIYNDSNGRPEENIRFQTAWLPKDKQRKVLSHIASVAEHKGWRPENPPVIFVGQELSRIESRPGLADLRDGAATSSLDGWPVFPCGAAAGLSGEVAVTFPPQGGANLLIIAQDSALRKSLLVAGLTVLVAQRCAGHRPEVHLVDAVPGQKSLRSVVDRDFLELGARIHGSSAAQLGEVLSELLALKEQRRQAASSASSEALSPHFLLLSGAHQMDALRNDPYQPGAGKAGAELHPSRIFEELLRSGPDLGIHVVMVCDRFSNYSQMIDSNRRLLRAFDLRIGLQMSAEDSNVLFASAEAAHLGPRAALFHHTSQGESLKFRPFQLPDPAWVKGVFAGA